MSPAMSDNGERKVGKTLAIASLAVAALGCIGACFHAASTWHGENYEQISVTFAILAIGSLSALILGILSLLNSRGNRTIRRLAAVSVFCAVLSPGVFFLWMFVRR